MLTEPVECKSCGGVSVNGGTVHCHGCFKKAYREGYATCLQDYGIWKNGKQYIGCMETHIQDALRKFDESGHADYWAKNCIVSSESKPKSKDKILKLKEGLISIANTKGCECDSYHGHTCLMCKVRQIAREALHEPN
jgi:hypothetical protein